MTILQEAVINKLLNTPQLQALLTTTPGITGGVLETQGFNLANTKYPCVMVGIASDVPMNGEQLREFAGRQNHRVLISIEIFDKNQTSKLLGQIDQVIRETLEGAPFDYPGVCVCYCEFESVVIKERDPDTGIWHLQTQYALIARVV